jgi:hypothetical protein
VFKRAFWLVIGAGFGFGVAFFVLRFVRQAAERVAPDRVRADVAGAIRDLGRDLREAVAEGREAMREREEAIRAEIGER